MSETKSVKEEEKSYARELTSLLLVFSCGVGVWGVHNPQAFSLFQILFIPSLTVWAAAFGIDKINKQWRD